MKFTAVVILALAAAPALSATVKTSKRDLGRLALRDPDAEEFPDKVKCPSTDAASDKEFEKDYLEDVAKTWAPTLNDKKSVSKGSISQGYPARFATGKKDAPENSTPWRFWKNTENMKFSDDCLNGYIWEIPLLDNGAVWSPRGGNGDAGPYRVCCPYLLDEFAFTDVNSAALLLGQGRRGHLLRLGRPQARGQRP